MIALVKRKEKCLGEAKDTGDWIAHWWQGRGDEGGRMSAAAVEW